MKNKKLTHSSTKNIRKRRDNFPLTEDEELKSSTSKFKTLKAQFKELNKQKELFFGTLYSSDTSNLASNKKLLSKKQLYFAFKNKKDKSPLNPENNRFRRNSLNVRAQVEGYNSSGNYLFGKNEFWFSDDAKVTIIDKEKNLKTSFHKIDYMSRFSIDKAEENFINDVLNELLSEDNKKHFHSNNQNFFIELSGCDCILFYLINDKNIIKKKYKENLIKLICRLEEVELDFILPISSQCVLVNFNVVNVLKDNSEFSTKINLRLESDLIQLFVFNNMIVLRNNDKELSDSNLIEKIIFKSAAIAYKHSYFNSQNEVLYDFFNGAVQEVNIDDESIDKNNIGKTKNDRECYQENHIEEVNSYDSDSKNCKENSFNNIYQYHNDGCNDIMDKLDSLYNIKENTLLNNKLPVSSNLDSTADDFITFEELFRRLIMISIFNVRKVIKLIDLEKSDIENLYLKDMIGNNERKHCYTRIFKLEESASSVLEEIKEKYSLLTILKHQIQNYNLCTMLFNTLYKANKNEFDHKKFKIGEEGIVLVDEESDSEDINNQVLIELINHLSEIDLSSYKLEMEKSSLFTKINAEIEQLISYLLEIDVLANSQMTSITSVKRNFKIVLDDMHRVQDTKINEIMAIPLIFTSLSIPIKLCGSLLGMNVNNPIKSVDSLAPFFTLISAFLIIMIFQFYTLRKFNV